MGGSPVAKDAAALRAMFKWQFGACCEEWGPPDRLVDRAMRYTESYALGYGSFAVCPARLTAVRVRSRIRRTA